MTAVGAYLLAAVLAVLAWVIWRPMPTEATVSSCGICNARFLAVEGLKQHVEATHPKTHEELFVCVLCGDDVVGNAAILAHMERKHGGPR